MVMHWKRQRGAPFRMAMNGLGAFATGITTLVVLVAKFVEGAWITALLIAFMIVAMRAVNSHYRRVNREIDLDRPIVAAEVTKPVVVVPIDRWSRISEKALSFALSMSDDIRCVHVQITEETDQFCAEWEEKIASPLRLAGKCVPKLDYAQVPLPLHPAAGGGVHTLSGAGDGLSQGLRAGSRTSGAPLVGEPVAQPARRSVEGDSAAAREPAHHRHQHSLVSRTGLTVP